MELRRICGGAALGLVLALATLGVKPVAVAAQQTGAQQAGKQEQPVDSTRIRALERLKMLGRAPGADSALYLQDSVKAALAQEQRGRAGAGADSTLAQLFRMPGYDLTQYEGGKADFGAKERVLVLAAGEGEPAKVNREGLQVQADTSITYSEASGRIRTVGLSSVTPPTGESMESGSLIYDMKAGYGSALGVKTAYDQQGATWYVSGNAPLAAQDSTFMSHAQFTSCDLTVPHYHFETDEIKIVGGKVLVARPVRLYFADVPVAWLPFMAQSLSSGRASGILTPTFSLNDIVRNSTGYKRRISNLGFYWAMSDYTDAVLALDWFSDNYLALTSQFQYRIRRLFLNGNVNLRQYWRQSGSTEFALDTQHSWDVDERTSLRVSGRFVTSTDFLQQNSFNPQEVTQSVNSQGGINRRFDWGTMSVSANRQQYLSDQRVAWTLPAANINLSTITLFQAPPNRAHFWNNMTWGGRASVNRQTLTRLQADTFNLGQADTENRSGSVSSSLSMGNLSFSQSLDLKQAITLGIPETYIANPDEVAFNEGPARSVNKENLTWNLALGYQQHLIGSTTLTPSVSFSGAAFRSNTPSPDTAAVASSFLSEPSRMSLSASLKTDVYGFWPGFAGFSAIRHKFSPTFDFSYTPEVSPSEQQIDFFGATAVKPKKTLSVRINNTIEAKRKEKEDTTAATAADSLATGRAAAADTSSGPRRQERAQTVQILGLNTGVVNYDLVRRDTLSSFVKGFTTLQLSNTITSDYLHGLNVSMVHDLFKDSVAPFTEAGPNGDVTTQRLVSRQFSLHLAQLNLGFALNNRSKIFQLLGLAGSPEQQQQQEQEEAAAEADTTSVEYTSRGVDDQSVIPAAEGARRTPQPRSRSQSGWNANFQYSLTRPRDESAVASQMLSGTVTLHPTEAWDMSWRSSYDLELHRFNDHYIRLSRDLHRWEANFDFVKTATGNWQFRFEVSLTDNRDLKFDYQQRNLDAGRLGGGGAPGLGGR